MAKHLHPMQDRIIVKRAEADAMSKGGIIFAENAKERPQSGTVVEVGPGRYTESGILIPTHAKVGDEVMFGKYAGAEIRVSGVDYIIMREDEIFATVSDDGVAVIAAPNVDLDKVAPILRQAEAVTAGFEVLARGGPIAAADEAVNAVLDREIRDHEADVNPEPIVEQDGKVIDRRRSFGVGAGS